MKKSELVWIVSLNFLTISYCLLFGVSFFLSSVLLSGILCVSLIALGKREGYFFGVYNSGAYSWVAFENGLFGEVLLNLLFYIPTGIIGLIIWSKSMRNGRVNMRSLPYLKVVYLVLGCFILVLVLGKILSTIPGQNEPYIDSTTNVLSIFATFLMMWRYKEQWLLYIVLNVITISMWLIRWYSGGFAGDLMVFMWALYLANSIYGYWNWSKGVAISK